MTPTATERFDALYQKTFDRLAARVGRQVSNRADGEDIAARAFIKLWNQIGQGFNDDLGARLNTIVQSEIANHWRFKARHYEEPSGLSPEQYDGKEVPPVWAVIPPEDFDTVEFQTDFDRAIRALPEDERDPFILTELRGLTVREAAEVSHTAKSTLADHAEAARTYLAKELSR